jgi:hypothetical protein
LTTPTPAAGADRQRLASQAEALCAALAALPPTEALGKALHHAERLAIAIRASHNEATRFAAFTVLKILRDHAAELPEDVAARAQALRAGLEATGLDLSK